MKLPTNKKISSRRVNITSFGGYNVSGCSQNGELVFSENISCRALPAIAPFDKGQVYKDAQKSICGMAHAGKLSYIDGESLVYGDCVKDLSLVSDGRMKSIVALGNHIIILPDKKYVRTEGDDIVEHGDIDYEITIRDGVTISLCNSDGSPFSPEPQEGNLPPPSPSDGEYWLDTSREIPRLFRYDARVERWYEVSDTYVKIEFPQNMMAEFKLFVNDFVDISGIEDGLFAHLNGCRKIYKRFINYIVVNGISPISEMLDSPITISRKMPIMDHVISSGGRLWGCRYGLDQNGKFVNKIYASRVGDIYNWHAFEGKDTDSIELDVGAPGEFTAAISHLGKPYFSKSDCFVYVSGGASPHTRELYLPAVTSGLENSISSCGDLLIYASQNGIYKLEGGGAKLISAPLGQASPTRASAGFDGYEYFISLDDCGRGNGSALFAYCIDKDAWRRIDGSDISLFSYSNGNLYYLLNGSNQIMQMPSGLDTPTRKNTFCAELILKGRENSPTRFLRLDISGKLALSSYVGVLVRYSPNSPFELVGSMRAAGATTISIPLRQIRVPYITLRLEGHGNCAVTGVSYTYEILQ